MAKKGGAEIRKVGVVAPKIKIGLQANPPFQLPTCVSKGFN